MYGIGIFINLITLDSFKQLKDPFLGAFSIIVKLGPQKALSFLVLVAKLSSVSKPKLFNLAKNFTLLKIYKFGIKII